MALYEVLTLAAVFLKGLDNFDDLLLLSCANRIVSCLFDSWIAGIDLGFHSLISDPGGGLDPWALLYSAMRCLRAVGIKSCPRR